MGGGTSYGAEFLYEARLPVIGDEWSVAYTWSKTGRVFPYINGGQPFPARYDRRHIVNANAQWKGVSAGFTLQSGHWETVAAGHYIGYLPGNEVVLDYFTHPNNWQQAQILRQEQLIPSRRGLWQGRLTATTRLSDKVQLFYRCSGSVATSRIEGGNDLSRFTYLQQSLTGQFSLGKCFRLDGSVEHYFNDAITSSHRHIVFADLAFAWIHGQTELHIEARNLFNHREFNYATSNNLIDTSTVSPLRPTSVLLKLRFSL